MVTTLSKYVCQQLTSPKPEGFEWNCFCDRVMRVTWFSAGREGVS